MGLHRGGELMQPLGRRKIKFPGKRSHQWGKKFVDWWEDVAPPSKKRARQAAKKDIRKELVRGREGG